MRQILRYGFILGIICIIASGLLAGVNSLTQPRIILQAQAEEEAGLKEVMPEAMRFEPVKSAGEIIYYKAYDKNGKVAGFAFKASRRGYSSVIDIMVGMDKQGTIMAIKILSQNETPGLGSRILEPSFTSQFKDAQGLSEVQAITGATISSRAVIDSVRQKAEEIQGFVRDEK